MKPLIRSIVLTASLLVMLLPKRLAMACGFYVSPGDYRFWLLQPDLVNEQDLTPFYFATSYLYNNELYAGKESYPRQNIEEWYRELQGQATREDIDSLLNHTSPSVFFSQEDQLARGNGFLRWLRQPGHKEFHQYMVVSKKLEEIAANPDPWEERNYPVEGISTLIGEADKLRKQTSSSFLKLRYAFQIMRLYSYNAQGEKLSLAYDNLVAPVKSDSWIRTAALYLKAIHTPGAEGDYLLSRVFDAGGYNRSFCLVKFQSDNYGNTLRLAKNNHERNVIRAMKVFNDPGKDLEQIKSIYQSEPNYRDLPFLLLREINKVEDWLVTLKLSSFERPATYEAYGYNDGNDYNALNRKNDLAYAHKLNELLLQMIREQKGNAALLHLFASHLAFLLDDPAASEQHLALASRMKGLPTNLRTQIAVNSFLLQLDSHGFDAKTEKAFMDIISQSDEKLGIYDPGMMKQQLVLYTARKMIARGDRARGLMLLNKTDRALGLNSWGYKTRLMTIEETATGDDYDKMLQIFEKKNKSAFEKLITKGAIGNPDWSGTDNYEAAVWSRNKVLDMKSSWHLRHYQLEAALADLKPVPDSYFRDEPYAYTMHTDPFYLNIYAPHRDDSVVLTKKQVLAEMIRLEKLAAQSPAKAAEAYLLLGNAWFNLSYHGKNWLMVKQWWSSNEPEDFKPDRNSLFQYDYYGCRKAMEYYRKSMEAARTKRVRTFAAYMVMECRSRFRDYREYVTGKRTERSSQKSLAGSEGFTDIDKEYYRQLVQECETYQSFISQLKKK